MPTHEKSLRLNLVSAYKECHSFAQVARKFNVDTRSVRRWVQRMQKTGDVGVLPGAGRKPEVSKVAARRAVQLLLSSEGGGCHQAAQELHSLGLTRKLVHRTTIARHAKAQAAADGQPISPATGKPSKALTAKTKAQRLEFCQANLRRDWSRVLFTDRKKFAFTFPGTRVKRVQWLPKGERRAAFRPNKPMVVNMYAGIGKPGVTKPHFVTGTSNLRTSYLNMKGQPSRNISSQEYGDVLTKTLLPGGKELLGNRGLAGWVLQQDNDPTHKQPAARAIPAWNRAGNGTVTLLEGWPPNSPDLSPIENAWAIVQARVDAAGCETFQDFKQTVEREWAKLSKKECRNLIGSMRERLEACVAVGGDKTRF